MKSNRPTIKMILLGNSGVGKSALMTQFAEEKFPESHLATIGIDFKWRELTLCDEKTVVQVWDTAGQERYRTITANYMRSAQAVMLVFDVTCRESFEKLVCWMEIAELSGVQEVPFMLVGNKIDTENRAVTKKEARRFADEHSFAYMETSAKTGENVMEAFVQLSKAAKRLPPVQVTGGTPILPVVRPSGRPMCECS